MLLLRYHDMSDFQICFFKTIQELQAENLTAKCGFLSSNRNLQRKFDEVNKIKVNCYLSYGKAQRIILLHTILYKFQQNLLFCREKIVFF